MLTKPAPPKLYYQDPDARLDYSFDWSARALVDDDAITASTWSVDDATLTLSDPQVVDGVTTVWISGGLLGKFYRVTNQIETSGGRRDDRSFLVRILHR